MMKTNREKSLKSTSKKTERIVAIPPTNNVQFDSSLQISSQERNQTSQVLEWMKMNRNNTEAQNLTYSEISKHYVWNRSKKEWRKRTKGSAVDQMQYISPSAGDEFYIRILLSIRKGATSFEDLRTVHGILYPTYQEACAAIGLLEDNNEFKTNQTNQIKYLFKYIKKGDEKVLAASVGEETSADE